MVVLFVRGGVEGAVHECLVELAHIIINYIRSYNYAGVGGTRDNPLASREQEATTPTPRSTSAAATMSQ